MSTFSAVFSDADAPGVNTRLTVDHVMASSSLPLMFPAIRVRGSWCGDGSTHYYRYDGDNGGSYNGVAFREVRHEPTRTSREAAEARGEPERIGGKAIVAKVDDVFRLMDHWVERLVAAYDAEPDHRDRHHGHHQDRRRHHGADLEQPPASPGSGLPGPSRSGP